MREIRTVAAEGARSTREADLDAPALYPRWGDWLDLERRMGA